MIDDDDRGKSPDAGTLNDSPLCPPLLWSETMLVDLVKATTRDGVTLEGALERPGSADKSLELDAAFLVHGTGSNFYSSTMIEALADRLRSKGLVTLRVNTRGHDGISTAVTSRGGVRLGAAFEVVDDCRHDLASWHEFLVREVGPRVLWLGHSLGAVKCLYAAAAEQTLKPAGVAAISPPRLAHHVLAGRSKDFVQTYERAQALFAAGEAGLMEVRTPLPMFISPAGYVEKYGPDERYDFFKSLGSLSTPTLLTFGEKELADNIAFQGLHEADELRWPRMVVKVVADADHFYAGKRAELSDVIDRWLDDAFATA